MKILFVCASGGRGRLQLGGAERFLMETLPALYDGGRHEIHAALSDPTVIETLKAQNIKTYFLEPKKKIDFAYSRNIQRLISDVQPDVVSVHLLSSAMHTRALGKFFFKKKPSFFVTLHNSLWQYVKEEHGKNKAISFANLCIDRFLRLIFPHDSVAVSSFEFSELKKCLSRGRLHLIDNCLPANWHTIEKQSQQQAQDTLELPKDKKIVLYLGRLEYEKGADLLLPIARSLPEDHVLVAVGNGTIDIDDPRIIHRSHTKKPELYYQACDVAIVPSRVESFGRVALEAVSLGTPVVHSGVGGLKKLLLQAEDKLAFNLEESRDETIWAATITELTKNPKRQDLVLQKRYVEEYSFHNFVNRWESCLAGKSKK